MGGLAAELVYVGEGSEDDFAHADVTNKIALVASSYTPPRQEKIRLAELHGASGILVMHWGEADSPLMVRGNAKGVWGNPTTESVGQLPNIPAVGISRRDGLRLLEMMERGPLEVVLEAESEQRWANSLLPLIRIPGQEEPDNIIVVGGHFDSWAGGATDNAVGDGFMMELASALWQRRAELKRSVWIAFWPGHETATMSGSSWFVDVFWDELSKGGVAYVNVDTLGLAGSSTFIAHSSPELSQFAQQIGEETLGEEITVAPLARTGDQSFFGIGIPALYGRTTYDAETLQRTHGATLGWWNHSHPSKDTMDKVDPELVEKAGRVIERWVWELINRDVLPLSFSATAQLILERLDELILIAPEGLRLNHLREVAAEFSEKLTSLEAKLAGSGHEPANVRRLNASHMALSRILTPALRTVAGRYGQDPYGLSALKTLLPGLYCVDHQYQNEADELIKGAMFTTILRERNRVSDALQNAVEEVNRLLDL